MNFSQKAPLEIFPKVSPWSQEGSIRSKSLTHFLAQKKQPGGKLSGWWGPLMGLEKTKKLQNKQNKPQIGQGQAISSYN